MSLRPRPAATCISSKRSPPAIRLSARRSVREPAALDGLHGHINAVIAANPEITIAAIWERLADEHATTVAYPTLRTYISNHRNPSGP